MKIDVENLVSMSEANQNFSKVVKKLEKDDSVIILKNNKPKYIILNYKDIEMLENKEVELVAKKILNEHKRAFEVLAE